MGSDGFNEHDKILMPFFESVTAKSAPADEEITSLNNPLLSPVLIILAESFNSNHPLCAGVACPEPSRSIILVPEGVKIIPLTRLTYSGSAQRPVSNDELSVNIGSVIDSLAET